MERSTKIQSALSLFIEASIRHAVSIENGDYKTANTSYDHVTKAVADLKSEDALHELVDLLTHAHMGIRLAAATFLLPTHEQESKMVLREIENTNAIHSFRAEMILREWQKGNLKL